MLLAGTASNSTLLISKKPDDIDGNITVKHLSMPTTSFTTNPINVQMIARKEFTNTDYNDLINLQKFKFDTHTAKQSYNTNVGPVTEKELVDVMFVATEHHAAVIEEICSLVSAAGKGSRRLSRALHTLEDVLDNNEVGVVRVRDDGDFDGRVEEEREGGKLGEINDSDSTVTSKYQCGLSPSTTKSFVSETSESANDESGSGLQCTCGDNLSVPQAQEDESAAYTTSSSVSTYITAQTPSVALSANNTQKGSTKIQNDIWNLQDPDQIVQEGFKILFLSIQLDNDSHHWIRKATANLDHVMSICEDLSECVQKGYGDHPLARSGLGKACLSFEIEMGGLVEKVKGGWEVLNMGREMMDVLAKVEKDVLSD
ncbi:hypothetical protein HDU76_010050 [Blyttiomyces sp. JEL0837]|nr:hypothetical protein HDU76_010050 [Blyttiomyces sp. JEL0837]